MGNKENKYIADYKRIVTVSIEGSWIKRRITRADYY